MPFINIYLPSKFTAAVKKRISNAVHESLIEIFRIPVKDLFQVIHPIADGDLIFPDSYLEVSHKEAVYISIVCLQGRTVEMKKSLYAAIAQRISETTPVSSNDVIIVLQETASENWSFGAGIAQMIK